jgi:hypothetical protein
MKQQLSTQGRKNFSKVEFVLLLQAVAYPAQIFGIFFKKVMELRKEDFPIALQAYELRNKEEEFLAEQVVNTQAEADVFMNRFQGKLIKAHEVDHTDVRHHQALPRRKPVISFWGIILLVIIILIIAGFATGWIQSYLLPSK